MKNILFASLILIIVSCSPNYETKPGTKSTYKKEITLYKVRITFCDIRGSRVIETQSNDFYIRTLQRALSEWHGYYNVCELELLSSRKTWI